MVINPVKSSVFCSDFLMFLLDTVGVEWSPDGKILASCSLDGTICFWNSDPNVSQTLIGKIERAHTGFIKGLSWDPAGKFLASQSDDGSCIVWNVESLLSSQSSSTAFNLDPSDSEMFKESVLEKIFVNMSKMTFFHRPGWSPDGSLLALANATNRQIPAVALVERNNWQGPGIYFVGHVGPVEAVRFNPRLFRSNEGMDRKEMICAVASQDGQVSIWSSSRTSPLLVLQDLFEHSVMDLAWTPDGTILVAVSYDGAAVAIKMNTSEFGLFALTSSEQGEHLKNVFGDISAGSGESSHGYVESVKVIECLRENEQFLSNCTLTKEVEIQRNEQTGLLNDNRNDNRSDDRSDNTNNIVIDHRTTVSDDASNDLVQPLSHNLVQPPSAKISQATATIVNGKKRITPQLVNISSGTSQPLSLSQNSRFGGGGGVRLRDEDFLIHRKLLERTSGILLNRSMKENNENSVFEVEEGLPGSISVTMSDSVIFSVCIEVTNHDVNGRKCSALIQFIQNSQILWKERIRGTIYLCSGTRKYSSFAIQNENQKHSLLVLTSSGRRFFPPISLDSRAIYLKICFKTENLILITKTGLIKIWNLRESKLKFFDSSIEFCLPEIPVKFLTFKEENLKLFYNENEEISYSTDLGIWIKGKPSIHESKTKSKTINEDCRIDRIEKLKNSLLSNTSNSNSNTSYSNSNTSYSNISNNNTSNNNTTTITTTTTNNYNSDTCGIDRQISELEFELSLIFINLRNGKELNSSEISHFERTLAIYALKLAKEAKSLKAKELIDDLINLNCHDLIEGLLKPFFTSSQNSYSSSWQDFISESF